MDLDPKLQTFKEDKMLLVSEWSWPLLVAALIAVGAYISLNSMLPF